MRRLLILTLTLLVALLPAAALADSDEKGGVSIRVNGDYRLPAEEEVEVLVVVDGSAEVAGTVHGALVVVNGDATVSGVVDGNITIVRGELELTDTAVVDDVQLIRSDLTRAPGATVRGDIDESDGWWAGWSIFFGIILLIGLAVALFVVAIGFALVGGKQLGEAARALTGKPLQTIVAGIVTVIGLSGCPSWPSSQWRHWSASGSASGRCSSLCRCSRCSASSFQRPGWAGSSSTGMATGPSGPSQRRRWARPSCS